MISHSVCPDGGVGGWGWVGGGRWKKFTLHPVSLRSLLSLSLLGAVHTLQSVTHCCVQYRLTENHC